MNAYRVQGARRFDDILYVRSESENEIELIRHQRNAWGEFEQPLTMTRAMFDLCIRTGYLSAVDIAPPETSNTETGTASNRMVV
ncbi:MAG: hypothetical protein ACOC4F_00470 [bacterium]